MTEAHTGLLDHMRKQLGAEYLSDLRAMMALPGGRWQLRIAVTEILPEAWPLEAWYDLTRYLTGVEQPCHSSSEARSALLVFIRDLM